MKFLEGDNTFRVLSSAIVGYEYFKADNTPVRSRTPFDETPGIKIDPKTGKPEEVKHFWAFPVWNYEAERVQILQVTQKGIMTYIKSLVDNKRWGNPTGYDITVNRTGSGLSTEYTCTANPHSVLEQKVEEAWKKVNIDLNELFVGGEPFKTPVRQVELPEVKVDLEDDGSVQDPKF